MLTINVRVPADRERTGLVEVLAKSAMTHKGIACASADAGLAKRHGNAGCDPMRPWGHAPLGRYRFLASSRTPKDCHDEYGRYLLVFQPESGAALEAESFGRLLLLVYSEPPFTGEQLRRTQGGLRLDTNTLGMLFARTTMDSDAVLEISTLQPSAWWQFWRRAERGRPLAAGPAKFIAPPLDEISLAQAIASGKRFAPRGAPGSGDDEFLSNRDSDRSSGSSSHGDTPYAGRGGESGGAGASGSWDAPRGVDSAGRITAAAAGIAAGVVAADVLSATESAGATSDASADTGTSTSTNY